MITETNHHLKSKLVNVNYHLIWSDQTSEIVPTQNKRIWVRSLKNTT